MRELGVDGLTEDQRFLVVRDRTTDERFRVPLDEETSRVLHSLGPAGSDVPDDSTGPEQRMDQIVLTPREIQTRIRRGESPDDIATSAGVPIAQIEPFAGPVLAEREYMAQQARRTSVRRKHVTGSGVRLETLVDDGIRQRGHVPDQAVWDAHRREDGRWTVLITIADDAPATFLYDVDGRYIVPADVAAHELVGDVALPHTPDMALADVVRESARDALPVPGRVLADEPAASTSDDAELQLDLDLPEDIAAAEALLEEPFELGSVASLKEARDRRAQTAMAQTAMAQTAMAQTDDDASVDDDHDHLEASLEHDVAVPDDQPKKRHERRRVPSWDEIMFGDKHD